MGADTTEALSVERFTVCRGIRCGSNAMNGGGRAMHYHIWCEEQGIELHVFHHAVCGPAPGGCLR